MNHSRVAVPAFAVLASLAVFSPAPAVAGPAGAAVTSRVAEDPRESITVNGTGEAFGEPDMLTADFAVEATGATVKEALDRATTAANRMRDSLLGSGMARADLQTQNVTIGSTQKDDGKITGYTAGQGITVTVRDLSRAGTLISAAIEAGGDAARLNNVSFAVENDDALLAQARKAAFADARAKAALYAGEAGRPLGRVVRVAEEAPSFGGWGGQKTTLAAADAMLPIEPGRQRLTVTVVVEWALGTAAA
ncbi:SIMPL domain-containing protein [Actinoplanes sp. NPDC023801]|uniref:SIMPL domain-containing protein n=1 Tax=Actinoplanes sp. NPDC023801 TaxID=3154595 RepID=UPI0033C75380